MADKTNAAKAAKVTVKNTLRSPTIGLKLEVVGPGEPVGPDRKIETLRVKRADGGIRDIVLSELVRTNGKRAVEAAIEEAAANAKILADAKARAEDETESEAGATPTD